MRSVYLLSVASGLLQVAVAGQLKHNQLCMSACQEAVGYFTFNGNGANASYYVNECTNELKVKSVYVCAKYYGKESDIKAGYAYLNNVCEIYGGISLLPYSIIGNMTLEDIEELTQVTTDDMLLGENFDEVILVSAELYRVSYRTLEIWAYEVNTHILYGWVMYIFWAIVIAVGLTGRLFSHLAKASTSRNSTKNTSNQKTADNIQQKIRRCYQIYVTLPQVFNAPELEPSTWYTIPPRIQTFTIFSFVFINFVLCCVNYRAFKGNLYWSDPATQRWRYIADRTGIISIANLPLVWLFGVRNNFLLWVTAWDFSAFNNFHRWVARVATLEAIAHSVAYSFEALGDGGFAEYASQWVYPYWYTGVIATIIMSLMLPCSILGLRRYFYEIFLYGHIVMSIIFLVNLWYHIQVMQGAYDGYFWPCVAIWVFDRMARLVRIALLQLKCWDLKARATYSEDGDIIRLEVPTLSSRITPQPGAYYYIYFFTGTRFWESHPFTLATHTPASPTSELVQLRALLSDAEGDDSVALLNPQSESSTSISPSKTTDSPSPSPLPSPPSPATPASPPHMTFLIRPFDGFTSSLRNTILNSQIVGNPSCKLHVLVEGPYGHSPELQHFDHVLFIVGGSGITVPLAQLTKLAPYNFTVVWAVRQRAFFEDVYAQDLGSREVMKMHVFITGDEADKEEGDEREGVAFHCGRPHVGAVIVDAAESGVLSRGKCAVVVCGPGGMVSEARAALLTALERDEGLDIGFLEESFSW